MDLEASTVDNDIPSTMPDLKAMRVEFQTIIEINDHWSPFNDHMCTQPDNWQTDISTITFVADVEEMFLGTENRKSLHILQAKC